MRISWAVLGLAIITGCEEQVDSPAPDPAPPVTTAPAAAAPQEPARLEPAAVTVADQPYLLPPMVLRMRRSEDAAELLLSGHEQAEPTGNTLVLSMPTEAKEPGQLAEMPWTYQAPSDEWTDTNQGLTLRDERYVLRPFDVTVRFAPADGRVKVTIEGDFIQFDTNGNPEALGKHTPVEAEFDAALIVE